MYNFKDNEVINTSTDLDQNKQKHQLSFIIVLNIIRLC